MKRLLAGFFTLFVMTNLFAGENQEFRATWVITWEHINSGSSVAENKARIREIMDNHVRANMNAVAFQVRQSGTAYYNSSFETWGKYAGYRDPGYDPLAYAVEQAHARGLELHAWMNVFEASDTAPGSAAAKHPDWICRDGSGRTMTSHRALSPGLEEVRRYLLDVAMQIVNNYDIDGLHLDYVRWNEFTSSKTVALAKVSEQDYYMHKAFLSEEQVEELLANPASRYLYDKDHPLSAGVPDGYATWEDWWRDSVTKFVRAVHDSIQAVKPWVRLSPAALGKYNWSGWNGYNVVFQDAALWFNEGDIDQLIGMHYHWTTGAGFYSMLEGGCPNCWSDYIQPGIADGRLFTVGPPSYLLADYRIWYRHQEIVDRSRDVPWVDGFQFFSYRSWRDQRYWDEARAELFPRKTKVRASGLIDAAPPAAPGLVLEKIDSLNYKITVTPVPGEPGGQRLAIYRSEDADLSVLDDEIIDVHFGETAYSFTDSFTGAQDYDGSYVYFATALDRFWNESEVSNSSQSNPIPSFAPRVVASYPADTDTIHVQSRVEVTFPKTMDVSTFGGAVSFDPQVPIRELVWSADNKTLNIETEREFDFDTHYTLTIAATVTDIIGKVLDGNGDGVSGDDYVLRFFTSAADVFGPQVVFSYPSDTQSEDFDVDEVLTFGFDEIVDAATVNSNSVFLQQDGTEVPMHYLLTTVNDRSVLSIQPEDMLTMAADYSAILKTGITDTLGNPMPENVQVPFRTAPQRYAEIEMIDDFTSPGDWKQPNYSGSTMGIIVTGTSFGFTRAVYPPATRSPRAAALAYQWDEAASTHLLREYLAGGAPRDVWFDSTYTLQCYLFGDGSGNLFRFALDDGRSGTAQAHEVSRWITIDWVGWRLVQWQLSDPNSVGEWLGNGVLDGPDFRIDSFQMTHESGAAISGTIYIDELRLIKRSGDPVSVQTDPQVLPAAFALYQNYPNPFNPSTKIAFDLHKREMVQLTIYDMLGRQVTELVNETLPAGRHSVVFDATNLPAGTYLYVLSTETQRLSRRLVLVK